MKQNLTILTLVILISYGCTKYDDGPAFSLRTKKARLSGEWELEEYNMNGVSQLTGSDYNIIWEFERNGDFTQTLDYGSYSYNYNGEWEFDDNGEELEIQTSYGTQTWEINRLSSNDLWLEVTTNNYYGTTTIEYEFEKN
ncbi:MAG: hypothetical protein CL850_00785 [Crocinitomicaceae bacterium]|nr:hypothetical protein [Crocinitomicaceae bacterium]